MMINCLLGMKNPKINLKNKDFLEKTNLIWTFKMAAVKIQCRFSWLVLFLKIWVFKNETKRGYNTTTKYILRLKYGEKFYGKKIADCFWHGFGFYLYIKKFCWPSVQITRAKLLSFMDVLKMSDDSHFRSGHTVIYS